MQTDPDSFTGTHTAWDLIGFAAADRRVRIKGGRALYDLVAFNDDTPGTQVCLSRLDVGPRGLRAVTRYVDPDTLLDIIPDDDDDGLCPHGFPIEMCGHHECDAAIDAAGEVTTTYDPRDVLPPLIVISQHHGTRRLFAYFTYAYNGALHHGIQPKEPSA